MEWLEMTKKSLLDDILIENKNDTLIQENEILGPILKEINLISDDSVKSFVRSILLKADLFWVVPSSFSGKYHPQDEHGTCGNLLHTIRVTRIANTICDSYSLAQDERDLILAACLLHDVTKGIASEDDGMFQYDPMHPYTVGQFVVNCQSYDKEYGTDSLSSSLFIAEEAIQTILRLVRCHLGPWSPVPETYPITYLDYIVHVADNIASKLHTYIEDSDLINEKWKPQ
jgi:23S rRNA maturation-related 3'-5' exoribonuclease YhaM